MNIEEMTPGVSRVKLEDDVTSPCYVFKSFDKPFYQPEDFTALKQELENLQILHNHFKCHPIKPITIAQLAAIMISPNSYHTGKRNMAHSVIRGFLLKYYSGGTLEDVLTNRHQCSVQRRWPLQIARGLQQLHDLNMTHMDLKPSNIVLNARNDIVIDVSDTAFIRDWLAPDMRVEMNPSSAPFEHRCANDIWAFGTLMLMLTQRTDDQQHYKALHEIIETTTEAKPNERMNLSYVISKLERDLIWAVISLNILVSVKTREDSDERLAKHRLFRSVDLIIMKSTINSRAWSWSQPTKASGSRLENPPSPSRFKHAFLSQPWKPQVEVPVDWEVVLLTAELAIMTAIVDSLREITHDV